MAIKIITNNKEITLNYTDFPQNALGHLIFTHSALTPRPLCTGIGKCGRCKVKYLSNIPQLTELEKTLLSQEEQKNNIRLACKHELQDNTIFEICDDLHKNSTQLILDIDPIQTTIHCNLFIDLGTTSIQWEVANKEKTYVNGQILNPQMIAGADVMARLYYVNFIEKKQKSLLQECVLNYIKKLLSALQYKNIIIDEILIGANPAMTAIFLGKESSKLMQAPYQLENKGNNYTKIDSLPPIYTPPQLSAFIGADACAGFAYVLANYPNLQNFILADLGTNGEFIFYTQQKNYAASIPLGPALEGVGMRCGGAVHGKGENIILDFSLSPFGLSYTCKGTPKFICGAAYLNLINILLSIQLIDRQGFFIDSISPLAKKIQQKIKIENNEKRLYVTENLYICAEDIENILKVKAAFSSAIEIFMEHNQIENIFLSGSLSQYIPLTTLENLGFLPKTSKNKTQILGNTSLKGLIEIKNNPKILTQLIDNIEKTQLIDLTNQEEYNSRYIENMHF